MAGTYKNKLFFAVAAVGMAVLLCGCINLTGPKITGGTLTRQEANGFLTQSKANIETISKAMEDTAAFITDANMEDETQMQAAADRLQGIRDTLKPILQHEAGAGTPEVMTQYAKAEKSCASKADDVIAELQGIMGYALTLVQAMKPMANLSNSDYGQVSQVFSSVNEQMKAITPPTFLTYLHAGLNDAIADCKEDLDYMMASAQINDPLRLNSGMYRLNVIMRQINTLTDESSKGFDRRKGKIEGDVAQTKAFLEAMQTWVETNAAALQKNTRGDMAGVALEALPSTLTGELQNAKINCTFEAKDTIIPANYRSLDYIVYLSAWSDNGPADVLVSVEIPEFTQKYEQKVTLGRAETQIKIHPPLLEGAARSLQSSRDAQINISVTDIDSGKPVLQETKPLKILSRYDMQWAADDDTPYYENVLAWVTPEAAEVKELLRAAADSINAITQGDITFIGGYQSVQGYQDSNVTATQAAAIMNALAAAKDVKYVATPFSSSGTNLQRVATPAEVIKQRSGLCIETTVTVASALQATNMHAALLILPTHAQVALETWRGSGEYFLIETTQLDGAKAGNYENVLYYYTKDQWNAYIQQKQVTVIDCDLAQTLGIKSID